MLILDTHALVWMDSDAPELGRRARQLIDRATASDRLGVVAISFWEVAMLVSKGRIALARPAALWRRDLLAAGLREVAIDGAVGIAAAGLADLHADPADRIIVAAAQQLDAHLLTADARILAWQGGLETVDARR